VHELALARSVFRIADRAAQGRAVSVIYLDVGVLRQVVPHALEFAWSATAKGSPALAASRLKINLIPARITCLDCQATTTITQDLVFRCQECGSTNYRVQTGEEFTLTAIDIAASGQATPERETDG